MLDGLKSKIHNLTKPNNPTPPVGLQPAGVALPNLPQEQTTFEVGKEVMIRDPKTGEHIYRMAMSPENKKKVFDVITKNAGVGQRLINLSVNLAGILRQLDIEDKGRIQSEKDIEAVMNQVRDDMKVPKMWGLNMQLGLLERREPPDA